MGPQAEREAALDDYVRELVLSQPEPPREPSWTTLLVKSYFNRVALILVAFGFALGLAGVLVTVVAAGPLWQRGILLAVSGLAVILFAGVPAFRAARYFRAVRRGVRVVTEVLTASWSSPGIRPPTIEAGSHGTVEGIRLVLHPLGEFEEPFESDKAWASQLRPGDRLLVLADPLQPRVLLELGLDADPARMRENLSG